LSIVGEVKLKKKRGRNIKKRKTFAVYNLRVAFSVKKKFFIKNINL